MRSRHLAESLFCSTCFNTMKTILIRLTIEEHAQSLHSRLARNKYFPKKQFLFRFNSREEIERYSRREKFACTHTCAERHARINGGNATMEYRVNCIAAAFASRAAARPLRLARVVYSSRIYPSVREILDRGIAR